MSALHERQKTNNTVKKWKHNNIELILWNLLFFNELHIFRDFFSQFAGICKGRFILR